MMVRYHTGHEVVAADDQVQFEVAASYRHYHAALMYVALTGRVDPRHQAMFEACSAALAACHKAASAGGRVRGLLPECLLLHHGRHLSADLDGLSDDPARRAN